MKSVCVCVKCLNGTIQDRKLRSCFIYTSLVHFKIKAPKADKFDFSISKFWLEGLKRGTCFNKDG